MAMGPLVAPRRRPSAGAAVGPRARERTLPAEMPMKNG